MEYYCQQNVVHKYSSTSVGKLAQINRLQQFCTGAICLIAIFVFAFLLMSLSGLEAIVWLGLCTVLVAPLVCLSIVLTIKKKVLTVKYSYIVDGEYFLVKRIAKRNKIVLRTSIQSIVAFGNVLDKNFKTMCKGYRIKKMVCNFDSNLFFLAFDFLKQKTVLIVELNQEMLIVLKRNMLSLSIAKPRSEAVAANEF